MDCLIDILSSKIGEKIIFYDLQSRRFEGIIEKVFGDFFQVFETKQKLSRVFRASMIKDLSFCGVAQ